MEIIKEIVSAKGDLKLLIFRRDDGHYQAGANWIVYDEEDDLTYWIGPIRFPGIYETVEIAEREGAANPRYRERISN